MSNTQNKFSWVQIHKEIVEYLKDKQNKQKELIKLLKDVGINVSKDKISENKTTDLEEIDPFTFFSFVYKHGENQRLKKLQLISEKN